jgi:hypothetical protein
MLLLKKLLSFKKINIMPTKRASIHGYVLVPVAKKTVKKAVKRVAKKRVAKKRVVKKRVVKRVARRRK